MSWYAAVLTNGSYSIRSTDEGQSCYRIVRYLGLENQAIPNELTEWSWNSLIHLFPFCFVH